MGFIVDAVGLILTTTCENLCVCYEKAVRLACIDFRERTAHGLVVVGAVQKSR